MSSPFTEPSWSLTCHRLSLSSPGSSHPSLSCVLRTTSHILPTPLHQNFSFYTGNLISQWHLVFMFILGEKKFSFTICAQNVLPSIQVMKILATQLLCTCLWWNVVHLIPCDWSTSACAFFWVLFIWISVFLLSPIEIVLSDISCGYECPVYYSSIIMYVISLFTANYSLSHSIWERLSFIFFIQLACSTTEGI